jgi:hypothetical protein
LTPQEIQSLNKIKLRQRVCTFGQGFFKLVQRTKLAGFVLLRWFRSLLPLDGPQHSDPGLRLLGLTGERRGTGILPRHGGCRLPVNVTTQVMVGDRSTRAWAC